MSITTLPALLGVFALAFLLLLLAKVLKQPAEDRTAKQLLILLLVGLTAMAFCLFYIYARMAQYWPRLADVEIGFVYWIGPSLYFYLRRLGGGQNPFANPMNLLHWAPALLIELALVPFFLLPLPEKTAYLAHPSGIYVRMIGYTWAGFEVHLLFYILLCQAHLRAFGRRMAERRSDAPAVDLHWLQLLCYGFMGYIAVEWLMRFVKTTPGLSQTAGMAAYLFIITVVYSALGQSRLRFANGWPQGSGGSKYRRSALRDDSARYYLGKLSRLMETERCYLDGDLSLKSLAERVKISPHHLSQILNDKLHKNFYEYINEQRVEHAKRSLVEDPARAITDIAFESGYNSKNAFYNAFKRHTGIMPAEYRRRHGESRDSRDPTTPESPQR